MSEPTTTLSVEAWEPCPGQWEISIRPRVRSKAQAEAIADKLRPHVKALAVPSEDVPCNPRPRSEGKDGRIYMKNIHDGSDNERWIIDPNCIGAKFLVLDQYASSREIWEQVPESDPAAALVAPGHYYYRFHSKLRD